MGSGNKLQRQKKGIWSLGERKVKHFGGRNGGGGRLRPTPGRETPAGSSILRAFKGGNLRRGPREVFL